MKVGADFLFRMPPSRAKTPGPPILKKNPRRSTFERIFSKKNAPTSPTLLQIETLFKLLYIYIIDY